MLIKLLVWQHIKQDPIEHVFVIIAYSYWY